MRSLIRELSGLLEEMVGLDEASGFISVVGQRIGTEIDGYYKQALKTSRLSKQQIADVLVDLKDRILGDFHVIEATEDKIVFGNSRCPFGDKVRDRPSLCMMTSNVFGTITAENNGYAKVALEQTIAKGDAGCRVTVFLNAGGDAGQADAREYFSGE
jgi:predicted ArsR family transcriptional regulator